MSLTMYPPQVNSPQTSLAVAIDPVQTSITVVDGSLLPVAPNILVLGDGNDAETILYTAKVGNDLSGITRGFQGTARAFAPGTNVARYFTAYDQEAIQGNISGHVGDTENPHNVTAAQVGAAPAAHATDVSNPHNVTAAQVGLDSVQNYGIATQAEAEAGTSDIKNMTPLKVKQSLNSEVTTTGAANKIVKATADGDIAASRYLKVGSNYIRYSNGQLEVSSNLTNWEVVGVPRYSNFNVLHMMDVDGIPTTPPVTLASYTGEGVITKIVITTQTTPNDDYVISYSIDGGSDIDINRPTAAPASENFAAGLFHGDSTYTARVSLDYYMNLYFSTSFEIKVRAAGAVGSFNNLYSAVMFNHA